MTQIINNFSSFQAGIDYSSKLQQILAQVNDETGFISQKLISKSDYYGTGRIGAAHFLGKFEGKSAILKIQAAKPQISEVQMIRKFMTQNKSSLIRAPKIYQVLPYDDQKGYEAIVMEYLSGEKVLASGQLQTADKIIKFFEIYKEYRVNCLNDPWLKKPKKKFIATDYLSKMTALMKGVKPNSSHRKPGDLQLATQAINRLEKIWQNEQHVFVHGHFSCEDLIWEDKQVGLLSNLFWRWTWPYYDAVFAYHWFMYSLLRVPKITQEQVKQQQELWLQQIFVLADSGEQTNKDSSQAGGDNITNRSNSADHAGVDRQKFLLKAALLERAAAGLLVDAHAYIDEDHPLAETMVEMARENVQKFLF